MLTTLGRILGSIYRFLIRFAPPFPVMVLLMILVCVVTFGYYQDYLTMKLGVGLDEVDKKFTSRLTEDEEAHEEKFHAAFMLVDLMGEGGAGDYELDVD